MHGSDYDYLASGCVNLSATSHVTARHHTSGDVASCDITAANIAACDLATHHITAREPYVH